MSDSIYRNRGLHKGVSAETVNELIARYRQAKTRRARQGFFLGRDFLHDLVAALEADPSTDGLFIKFGLSAKSGATPAVLELVATPVELEGGSSFAIKHESVVHYCSVGNSSTNPPSLPSPPLGGGEA